MTQPRPVRISPLFDRLQPLNGSWQTINDMPTLVNLPNDSLYTNRVGLADLSFLTRFGVKGAKAAAWLSQQSVLLPDRPNSWCDLPEGGIVARLGVNEFLIEDSVQSQVASQLAQTGQSLPAQVYPVLRQDAAIGLCGSAVLALLQQTCNVNFSTLSLVDRPVILTSMIGVSVIVIPRVIPGDPLGHPFYQIWCDGTFGNYVWQTLLTIAEELGGGAIGATHMINCH